MHYAVIGRISGADEDNCEILETETAGEAEAQAITGWRKSCGCELCQLWLRATKQGKQEPSDALANRMEEEGHPTYVNYVLGSKSPITMDVYGVY